MADAHILYGRLLFLSFPQLLQAFPLSIVPRSYRHGTKDLRHTFLYTTLRGRTNRPPPQTFYYRCSGNLSSQYDPLIIEYRSMSLCRQPYLCTVTARSQNGYCLPPSWLAMNSDASPFDVLAPLAPPALLLQRRGGNHEVPRGVPTGRGETSRKRPGGHESKRRLENVTHINGKLGVVL